MIHLFHALSVSFGRMVWGYWRWSAENLHRIDSFTELHYSFFRYRHLYSASSRLLFKSAPNPCTAKRKSFRKAEWVCIYWTLLTMANIGFFKVSANCWSHTWKPISCSWMLSILRLFSCFLLTMDSSFFAMNLVNWNNFTLFDVLISLTF